MDRPDKLGVYEILAPLGAGGMGEVYRARDPRLKREVAVKVLPAEAALDSERRRRFEQEAQAASALNHPHILVVHDFGTHGDIHYLVSELIEGESLRKLLQKGPLPAKRLLEIAVQIADGLSAAHQAGIVHRDLKPDNIMVTPENRVKILDFGLAKLAETALEEQETASRALSQSGIIHGTVPYMSPEQASGKVVDFRSDQFSFGLILYEMATGRRAFQQNTPVQVLSAIIGEEPAAISALNPRVPAPLRWMIERCMNKDPRRRYDSTADLYRDLCILKDHLSETTITADGVLPVLPRRRVSRQIAFVLTFLMGVLASVPLILHLVGTNGGDLTTYRITRLHTGQLWSVPVWSPDGNTIAYGEIIDGIPQIFTMDLKSLVSTQITTGVQDSTRPLWSADGSRIYFLRGGTQLTGGDVWVISAAGGPSEKILANVRSIAYSIKANAFVFSRLEADRNTLWLSSPPGAEPQRFSQLPANIKEILGFGLSFSPDGSNISLWAGTAEDTSFWLLPYPSGEPRRVFLPDEIVEGSTYSWMPDNEHIVFGSPIGGFRKGHLRLTGINDDTSRPLTAGFSAAQKLPAVSPDGSKIAFITPQGSGEVLEIPLDGSLSRVIATDGRSPVWSPIGTQYAFAGESGIDGIWLRSVSDHWTRPIVTARDLKADVFDSPSISPDGQRVAYQRDDDILVSPVSGGTPVRVVTVEYLPDFPSWSPDGSWISFYDIRRRALAKVAATGTGTPTILKEGAKYVQPRWSPKGDWITYIASEGLSLISPDGKTSRLLAPGNWANHTWSHDGRTIYGLKFEGQRIWLTSVELGTGLEKKLNELAPGSNAMYLGFSLAPDGSSVITSEIRGSVSLWLLEDFAEPTGFFSRFRKK